MKTRLFFIALLFAFTHSAAYTQGSQPLRVIGAAGNVMTSGGYSLYYTVGEVAVASFNTPTNKLRQGFWQSDLSFKGPVAVVEVDGGKAEITVFPNPFEETLQLKISGDLNKPLEISTYDMNGRLLLTEKILPAETVQLEGSGALPAGTYLLFFRSEQGLLLGSAKVTKVQ